MSLPASAREITVPIGAGGRDEASWATDTKLNRDLLRCVGDVRGRSGNNTSRSVDLSEDAERGDPMSAVYEMRSSRRSGGIRTSD